MQITTRIAWSSLWAESIPWTWLIVCAIVFGSSDVDSPEAATSATSTVFASERISRRNCVVVDVLLVLFWVTCPDSWVMVVFLALLADFALVAGGTLFCFFVADVRWGSLEV